MAKKILIVDDEETSRRILALALEGHDHELIYAKDGQEAVDLAVRELPDLIVMDIDLPKKGRRDRVTVAFVGQDRGAALQAQRLEDGFRDSIRQAVKRPNNDDSIIAFAIGLQPFVDGWNRLAIEGR